MKSWLISVIVSIAILAAVYGLIWAFTLNVVCIAAIVLVGAATFFYFVKLVRDLLQDLRLV